MVTIEIEKQEMKVIAGSNGNYFQDEVNKYLAMGWIIQSSHINSFALEINSVASQNVLKVYYFAILVKN
jgi:hypothetical protein